MTKTRVFFDVSALPKVGKSVTGISRVIYSILVHMVLEHPAIEVRGISFRLEDNGYRIWTLADIGVQVGDYLSGIPKDVISASVATELQKDDVILLLGEQWLFDFCIPTLKEIKRDKNVKIISLVHDLVPFFMPELYWDGFPDAYKNCIDQLVRLSDQVVVYSKSTHKDLIRFFPDLFLSGVVRISQIRLGDQLDSSLAVGATPRSVEGVVPQEYVLCVGTIQPRKNHLIFLNVWRRMLIENSENCPTLILVGKKGWNVDNFLYFCAKNPQLSRRILILEDVSDAELQWLYQNCMFGIYPSLYEGWGLPIAECLSAGKLCIASNASSMPEVAGDLIDYFSPYDSGELFRLVTQYILHPDMLEAKERSIQSHFTQTTWGQTTTQLIQSIGLAA